MPKKYIDADNTLSSVDRAIANYAENDDVLEFISEIRYAVIGQPGADVKEVKHGEWLENGANYKCSVCGNTESYYSDSYCRVCGARMDGGE